MVLSVDGGELALDVHGVVLRGSRGGVNGVLVVLHDVTRLRALERVRRQFAANVSHELRTPLTNIKGFVETLRDGAVEDAAARDHFLGIILHSVDRLNTLIEDLLMIARLEREEATGGVVLEDREIDGVLCAAVESCARHAESRNVRVIREGDRGVHARISATLLEQALVNLLDNAIKYGNAGGTVSLGAAPEAAQVRIWVRDQGPGIAAEHLPRLFERFYRVDKARSSRLGGTGLGLAIVKHIMVVHGGSVTVESTPGTGSTFCLHLPRGPEPSAGA
jgi:two-component system phosphate regulon sensor histidine kinase PhoR